LPGEWDESQDEGDDPRGERAEETHGGPARADTGEVSAGLDDGAFAQDAADLYRLALDLHRRGDINHAAQAYLHAEAAGVDDAAFNLGVLLFDAGDYDGAEMAWTRCLAHQHARAATNLGFLLAQRGDLARARMAYSAAELWGDPEARRLADDLPSAHDA
jgi:tetratricopeptide (TPR) repeat protein